ncbi:hypothetical protein SNEBB_004314 [Seison nebaliae]|nr:hypothetical protein SNEBB_004314 [Seison nebaliae]
MVKKSVYVVDSSKIISEVQFAPFDQEQIRKQSECPVISHHLYDGRNIMEPSKYGVLDGRMGTSQRKRDCATCKKNVEECLGHFGHVDLELPVFHVGYFKMCLQILQSICKNCGRILMNEDDVQLYLMKLRRMNLSYKGKKLMRKKIHTLCKKTTTCFYCGDRNGIVKKLGMLKIVHDKFRHVKEENESRKDFLSLFKNYTSSSSSSSSTIGQGNESINVSEMKLIKSKVNEIGTNSNCTIIMMNPLMILELFNRIIECDIELLLLDVVHPSHLILQRLSAPPLCIRPSITNDMKAATTEDDLTAKLKEIVFANELILENRTKGWSKVMECWDYLQYLTILYFNSEFSGFPLAMKPKKWSRGLVQRLKGKKGRFRGNLCGKRVDFSARTVISPDPKLRIDQVAVPKHMAKILTFPEKVNEFNIEFLKKLIMNGPDRHPGANYIYQRRNKFARYLRYGNREIIAQQLRFGDVVERHLIDDDVVLFNRQPSLHKLSIMSFVAKVQNHRTLRFNECCCNPFNADFDGDEMNLHLPQTNESKAEAYVLMASKNNLVTPRNGEPLIAAIQDFITASYILTKKNSFFDKMELMRITSSLLFHGNEKYVIEIPLPCIIKPRRLWSGKQIFSMLLKMVGKQFGEMDETFGGINLRVKTKSYKDGMNDELAFNESFVVIRNSELLSGVIDKSLIGSGSRNNIFYALLGTLGNEAAAHAMTLLARLAPVFLSHRGFSIGLGDVRPDETLLKEKKELVEKGYSTCEEYIKDLENGKLLSSPGCTPEQTLESMILKELSTIRDRAGQLCKEELPFSNSPLIMAVCGSKGSFINISQMIACVGQQAISGSRIPNGFEERSLPHFPRGSKIPAAKGFVANSFYTGLTPPEFFFHTMAGREGLVDTAVKTAETGYMQRRLVKCLEDLVCSYDMTVRTSKNQIVQFLYGGDALDPALMQTENDVVDFERLWQHVQANLNGEERKNNEGNLTMDEDLIPLSSKEIFEYLPKLCELIRSICSIEVNMEDLDEEKYEKKEMENLYSNKFIYHSTRNSKYRFCRLILRYIIEEIMKRVERTWKIYGNNEKSLRNTVTYDIHKVTRKQLRKFIVVAVNKYLKAEIEPGSAVGAVCAQSLGEPGTQMTLKTFHFAGVASMNITLGVPRIKEIINATKTISTPLITAPLLWNDEDVDFARSVKGRLETTTLGEVTQYFEEVYLPDACLFIIKLDRMRLFLLKLNIDAYDVANLLMNKPKLKLQLSNIHVVNKFLLFIRLDNALINKNRSSITTVHSLNERFKLCQQEIPKLIVKGISTISRAIITKDTKNEKKLKLVVEGNGLRAVLGTFGVDGNRTTSNNIMEVFEVLGIEAARQTICDEILYVMAGHGISVDIRHVYLLADLMTYRGEVLGITRGGLAKMNDSVLTLASFEKMSDHLFEASTFGQVDDICGVSERIIMGVPISLGTGQFQVLQQLNYPKKMPYGRKNIEQLSLSSPKYHLTI